MRMEGLVHLRSLGLAEESEVSHIQSSNDSYDRFLKGNNIQIRDQELNCTNLLVPNQFYTSKTITKCRLCIMLFYFFILSFIPHNLSFLQAGTHVVFALPSSTLPPSSLKLSSRSCASANASACSTPRTK